ncbi:hypothetical protein R52603_04090 [Paraburkholderia saeva]|nr:hypothetical protein R52603_04090 [Paraburkholderia saeva]CAG4919096.1 hypothetical protein R70241_04711 [Paraburkholderia saeva]
MRAYLVRRGIAADHILVDSAGNDDWSTARDASSAMREQRLSSATVVMQYFHLPGTRLALKSYGVSEVSGAYPRFREARDIYSIVRKVPAFIWYAIRPLASPTNPVAARLRDQAAEKPA